jgi:hypothetical protein
MSLLTSADGAYIKSTFSSGDGNCAEVAATGRGVQMRHSKHPEGPVLDFTLSEWSAFVAGAQNGQFNLS